jgi:hypothetical protein
VKRISAQHCDALDQRVELLGRADEGRDVMATLAGLPDERAACAACRAKNEEPQYAPQPRTGQVVLNWQTQRPSQLRARRCSRR